MSTDQLFSAAVVLFLLGVLGFGVTVVLQTGPTGISTHTPLAFWVVFAVSLASLVGALVLALMGRARLRRDITGR